jgi:beta-galactosidase
VASSANLNFLSYDVYPMFALEAETRGETQAFWLDAARSWTGNFLVAEHQSGAGGQGDYMLDTPGPGEMRRMAYSTLARGADGLLFFRWRTCRFGAEEYWCGILDHDNMPRRRYQEVVQIGRELEALGPRLLGSSVHVEVAIATSDLDNTGAHDALPLGLPKPWHVTGELHAAFFRGGYAVGCVHPADDLTGVRLLVVPHWVIIDPAWMASIDAWVRQGGVLVIGARSGSRDLDNNVVTVPLPGPLCQRA